MSPERLYAQVSDLVSAVASEIKSPVNEREQEQLARELFNDMTGLGPLQPLLNDESITDIMVNGPANVFIERGGLVSRTSVRFRDSAHLVHICQKIASGIGRHVDEASPMVDARLADGSRVNIVLPPIAIDGAAMSIRKFRKQAIGLDALVQFGSLTPQIAKLLEIVAHCRLNVIISGGTGSGKTTLLNAMSRHIEHTERIVTVEDAAELQLQQPHVVRLETRPQSREGGNTEVTARDLVRNALRMRPDRIIIGEVRGAEAFDMLQAMNTGHDGSMSTVHANNVRDAVGRIESMVQMSNSGLTIDVVRKQIVSAVNIIIQIQRQRDGRRRLIQLAEVTGMEGNVPTMNDIVRFVIDGETVEGHVRGHYDILPVRSQFHERLVYFRLDRIWQELLQEASTAP
jgi:pilus assembly protein CpaF